MLPPIRPRPRLPGTTLPRVGLGVGADVRVRVPQLRGQPPRLRLVRGADREVDVQLPGFGAEGGEGEERGGVRALVRLVGQAQAQDVAASGWEGTQLVIVI